MQVSERVIEDLQCKGIATVELENGAFRKVELHWYEAHGVGRKEFKIKRYLE